MGRFLLLDAVFFLLPFVAYGAWLVFTRGSMTNLEDWQARTIAYLAVAGAGLLLIALLAFIHYQTIPPGGTYRPAHIEDGRIVPGQIVPDESAPGGGG